MLQVKQHRRKYSPEEISRISAQSWWTLRDTAIYLNRTYGSVRNWAAKVSLKRCPNDKRLTCKRWVDSALLGKS